MSRNNTKKFVVEVEQQLIDRCGNKNPSITEGMVSNGGRKIYKITKQKGKTFYNLVYDAFGGQNHQGGWVWSCGGVCAAFYTEMEAEKVIKEQNLVGCSIEEI